MIPFSFDPALLASAFPDVVAAVVIAFVLAVVTHRRPAPPSIEDAVSVISVGADDADGS